MQPINWSMIIDRLLRYYFPVIFLLPVLLFLVCQNRKLVHAGRRSVLFLCILLMGLIIADVFEVWLATLPKYTIWRVVASVPGFCIRPLCMLVMLLDTIPAVNRSRRITLVLSLPALINAALFCTAFFVPLTFSYTADNLYCRGPLYPVLIVVSVLYLILLAVNAISHLQRRQRNKGYAVLLISAACFLAAVMEMFDVASPTPLLNQSIAIGTLLYFLVQYMADSSAALENLTLSLLLMQIRPHFINNSLAAIRGMIRRDPDEAVEALNHFSGYLQDSMNSIMKTELIPFSKEMELIDNYLYMEQTRFRNSITVTRELIPVDFPVPPLTVQPLVENAVRHGLRGIQTPGHLSIRTEMDAREYRVIIEDNGCGFDPSQPPDPRRPHVGLKNVRTRLELMCSGKLSIQSSPNGTTAVIHIPIKMLNALQNKGQG